MNRGLTILLSAGCLLLTSCYRNRVFNEYQHTPIAGWEKNDTLSFNIPRMAASGTYSMDMGLRTNNAYPFMGLTLIVERTCYPGHTTQTDTLDCKLTDQNGNVKGQGISSYQFHYHVADLNLSQGDSLHVTIRHDMKREILPGISDIGIELDRK